MWLTANERALPRVVAVMLWIDVFWKKLRLYLGLMWYSSAVVVGRGKYGSYTLSLFTFYVLTFEDRKCFLTKNHLSPKLLATLAHNDILLLRTLEYMLPDPFHHSFLGASVFWSSIHASSPHVDGVGSELPMEILNGLQMTQREFAFCHLCCSHWSKLFNLSRPCLLLALLLSHNYED